MDQESPEKLEYNEYLQQMRTNPQANNGLGQFFVSKSGDKLYYRVWHSKNPKRILLGIHGMAAHGEYYVQVADQLISDNITTYALDLKQHGKSSGKKGDLKDFKTLIEQVNEFVLFLKDKHENLPIFLIGLSMGGCIGANYGIMYPENINGIILMAPAVKAGYKVSFSDIIRFLGLIFIYIFAKGKPVVDVAKRNKGLGTRNPLRTKYDETDEYRIKKVSIRYLLQLAKWVKKAFKNANKISCPVLIVQGTTDKLVSPEGVKEFFNCLTTKDKNFIELEGAYHCLFSDPAMIEQNGWNTIKDWILEH